MEGSAEGWKNAPLAGEFNWSILKFRLEHLLKDEKLWQIVKKQDLCQFKERMEWPQIKLDQPIQRPTANGSYESQFDNW